MNIMEKIRQKYTGFILQASNVKNILRQYGFPDKERVFQVGTSMEYEQIFKRIIIELQRCQDNYEEMLVLLLRHLLISLSSGTDQGTYLEK